MSSHRRKWGQFALTALLALAIVAPQFAAGLVAPASVAAAPAASDPYRFAETGHYVSGRFRDYYETRGGLYVFGLPITRAYWEVSTDGKKYLTQYFERARFEYHPENQAPYDVLLTLMGNEITNARRTESPFVRVANPNTPGGAYFNETGHTIGGLFLQFWTQYGGLQNFGFPLSEPFTERNAADGKDYVVQYFERERMELHPEQTDPRYQVLLGLLGTERANRVGIPAVVRAPEQVAPAGTAVPGGATANFPARHIEYGFNTYLIGNSAGAEHNKATLGKVSEAGFGWVRLQLIWRDVEPAKGQYHFDGLDYQIDQAYGAGANILLSVLKSPDWADPVAVSRGRAGSLPEDQAAFAALMRTVADRYIGKVQAYEIWNEQNLAGEVGGNVEVAPYVATLKSGYTAVKASDKSAAVLFGGLTPTGVKKPEVAIDDTEYLRQFYAYNGGEGKQYYDILAAHPGSAANAPETKFPDQPGDGKCPPIYANLEGTCWNTSPDFYFRRIEDQRAVMEQNGESAKQIWLTEFGWDACADFGASAPGYEYCQLTSSQRQGEYIVRAFGIAKNSWPWMGVMILWNLNYATIPNIAPGDEKYAWSVLGPNFVQPPRLRGDQGDAEVNAAAANQRDAACGQAIIAGPHAAH